MLKHKIQYWIAKLMGYQFCQEDPITNIPNVGDVCRIPTGWFSVREAVFKELPLGKRMSENEFRYIFEMIDGTYIFIYGGVFYKKTAIVSWEFDQRNPERKINEVT